MLVVTMFQKDLLPKLHITLIDRVGNPLDLSQVVRVSFYMGIDSLTLTINNRALTVLDAGKGICELNWQSGDTNQTGDYEAEVVVVFQGDKPQTAGRFTVRVEPSLHG